jgi:hypothetical protein
MCRLGIKLRFEETPLEFGIYLNPAYCPIEYVNLQIRVSSVSCGKSCDPTHRYQSPMLAGFSESINMALEEFRIETGHSGLIISELFS